jgi:hypothetical protein
MADKKDNYGSDTQMESSGKNPFSKHEYDLYHEDDDVAMPVIRVKRFASASREKWKILDDSKEALTIDGSKITKKEKEYLRTPAGFSFLVAKYKDGVKTVNKMRIELKKILK